MWSGGFDTLNVGDVYLRMLNLRDHTQAFVRATITVKKRKQT